MMRSTLRALCAVPLLLAATSCGDSPTEDAQGFKGSPNNPAAATYLTYKDVGTGKVTAADSVFWFVIHGPLPERLMLRLQAESGAARDTLVATVADLPAVRALSAGTDAAPQSSGSFAMSDGAPHLVAVRALRPGQGGKFTLRFFYPNPFPETHAQIVEEGETIAGEAIDSVGDVDVFSMYASAGQTVAFFI